MNIEQSDQEKHRTDIAQQVEFAKQNLPFYGYIRLRKGHTYVNILQNSIPGLVESISINETIVYATIRDGNEAIGQRDHSIPIHDIIKISVDRDINLKIIHKPETT